MTESVSTEPFRALAAALNEGGFPDYGRRLEGVLEGVWTTSTELILELGQVVVTVRKECRPLNSVQKALIKECLREVRKAWPGFAFFSWFPFNW